MDEPWEKERKRLIKMIREKKIQLDDNFILASDGVVIQLLRMDLLPFQGRVAKDELDSI